MKYFKYVFLMVVALTIISCKKNQLGGKSNIKAKVMHHDEAIPHARVYIKFNATDFPGTDVSVYDTYIDADHNGNFLVSNIYRGDYYFYAVGVDPALPIGLNTVTGGTYLKVKMFKEITGFVVPVTE